jgi:hypothetical protein
LDTEFSSITSGSNVVIIASSSPLPLPSVRHVFKNQSIISLLERRFCIPFTASASLLRQFTPTLRSITAIKTPLESKLLFYFCTFLFHSFPSSHFILAALDVFALKTTFVGENKRKFAHFSFHQDERPWCPSLSNQMK